MKLLNRIGFSVKPLQPYADWVNGLPAAVSELVEAMSLAEHQQECRVYLFDDPEADLQEWLRSSEQWQLIFDNELAAWDEFADCWPERNYEHFCQWFALEPLPLVFDAAEAALMRADLD